MNSDSMENLLKHTKTVVLIIFVMLFLFGGYFLYWYYEQGKGQVEVNAVCEKILNTEKYSMLGHNTIIYVCELGYDYNGIHYVGTSELEVHIKEGDKIKLKIDPKNPSDFVIAKNDWILLIIMIGVPLFLTVITVFTLDSKRPAKSKNTEETIEIE